MNNMINSRAMLRLLVLAASFALPACQTATKDPQRPTGAEEAKQAGNSKPQFAGIESARSATVVLEPMSLYAGGPEPVSCSVTTKDPALIASLINILNTDVKVDRRGRWPLPMREHISLTLANGEEVKFGFGPIVALTSPNDVKGDFIRGEDSKNDDDYLALSAPTTTHKALYEWALKVGVPPPTIKWRQQDCSFVRVYLQNLARCLPGYCSERQ